MDTTNRSSTRTRLREALLSRDHYHVLSDTRRSAIAIPSSQHATDVVGTFDLQFQGVKP